MRPTRDRGSSTRCFARSSGTLAISSPLRASYACPNSTSRSTTRFSAQTDTPILLERLGSDLAHKNHVKQLTAYLGATGVQWGVLSDGNRYVLYNSRGGTSFEEQKFLTLEIKTVNTDSGTLEEFLKHLTTLLSRDCLENEEIQQAYEEHD